MTTKLPLHCEATYQEQFLAPEEAMGLYTTLTTSYEITDLRVKTANGEHVITDFGKIMFMDKELYESNALPSAQWGKTAVWFKELEAVKNRLATLTNRAYHTCVCIYYPDGNSGVGFHSDYTAFGDTSCIPSISLGEERVFCLREKATQEVYSTVLHHGSLLVMGKHCQERYEHSLPTNPAYKNPRINLTFRTFGFGDT